MEKLMNLFLALFTGLYFGLLAATNVIAEPAVFTKGKMTIPEGAVITDSTNSYYSDITLAYDGDGALIITGADAMPLVQVESVDILVMESFPLQISAGVSGNLSVPCVKLLNPAVSYADNTFTVVLAESKLGPAESCIAVIEPFETSVPLEVLDLPAGTYTVDVNGVITEFTFDMDNSSFN
jgi:hypothetical protein